MIAGAYSILGAAPAMTRWRSRGGDSRSTAWISRRSRSTSANRLADSEGLTIDFRQGDVGLPLDYADETFDAVVSNLVLHSFDDTVLRRIVREAARCLRPGGLFLFHANSTEDLERRLAFQPPERQLGPRSYLPAGGQTMHFFSRDYCRGRVCRLGAARAGAGDELRPGRQPDQAGVARGLRKP